jgi:hypothetical protein
VPEVSGREDTRQAEWPGGHAALRALVLPYRMGMGVGGLVRQGARVIE